MTLENHNSESRAGFHSPREADSVPRQSPRTASGRKIRLRTKIFLITTLILILLQSLNCVLEIAFLYNHLEAGAIQKISTIGNEMARKLEKSMMFGKKLERLKFKRLLEGLMPEDIINFHTIDKRGNIIFRVNETETEIPAFSTKPKTIKSEGMYQIVVPLEKFGQALGNIVISVSTADVENRLIAIIRGSVLDSLTIFCVMLPILYVILVFFIDRPYMNRIRGITRALIERDHRKLDNAGITTENLVKAERTIEDMAAGWISMDHGLAYGKLRTCHRINRAVIDAVKSGHDPIPAIKSVVTWDEFLDTISETEAILVERDIVESLRRSLQSMRQTGEEAE